MLKSNSVISYSPSFEDISLEDVMKWLSSFPSDLVIIENNVANRLLYPQALPVTSSEMEYDLAILREILKKDKDQYFDTQEKRILIPESFFFRFPDLVRLTWAFIDACSPRGVISIVLVSSNFGEKNLGTIIKPDKIQKDAIISVWIDNKKNEIKTDSLVVLPAFNNKVDLKVEASSLSILGSNHLTMEVNGGSLGIVIDTR